jgi:hypothetical protein
MNSLDFGVRKGSYDLDASYTQYADRRERG